MYMYIFFYCVVSVIDLESECLYVEWSTADTCVRVYAVSGHVDMMSLVELEEAK